MLSRINHWDSLWEPEAKLVYGLVYVHFLFLLLMLFNPNIQCLLGGIIMSKHNRFSDKTRNRAAFRIQLTRLLHVILILGFLLVAVGMQATMAKNQVQAPTALVELPVVAASASTNRWRHTGQSNGYYNGIYNCIVGIYRSTCPSEWLQADFGSPQNVVRIEIYNSKRCNCMTVLLATDFAIWVGNDPAFAPGSYVEAPILPITRL